MVNKFVCLCMIASLSFQKLLNKKLRIWLDMQGVQLEMNVKRTDVHNFKNNGIKWQDELKKDQSKVFCVAVCSHESLLKCFFLTKCVSSAGEVWLMHEPIKRLRPMDLQKNVLILLFIQQLKSL